MTTIIYEVRTPNGPSLHVRKNNEGHFLCGLPLDSRNIYSAIPLTYLRDHAPVGQPCDVCSKRGAKL